MTRAKRPLVIGVGNAWRGDDAVGPLLARHLAPKLKRRARVIEEDGAGTALMDAWEGADLAIVLDAAHSGAPPGTVRRFEAGLVTIPTKFFHHSSHAFGLAEAVEMSRILGTLPNRLVVYAIEGETFDAGDGLSPAVAAAFDEVATAIISDLGG